MISQQVFGCCIAKFADTKLFDTRPPIYTQGHVRAVHIRYVSAHARGLGTVVTRGQRQRHQQMSPELAFLTNLHNAYQMP